MLMRKTYCEVNLGNLKLTKCTLLYDKSDEIKELYNNFEWNLLNQFDDLDIKYLVEHFCSVWRCCRMLGICTILLPPRAFCLDNYKSLKKVVRNFTAFIEGICLKRLKALLITFLRSRITISCIYLMQSTL